MASTNNSLGKNTIMLYTRTLLNTIVGLYTSRVVLEVLGVADYGVYSIVGGVVAILGFLNNSMGGATSRFITFELGRGCFKTLRRTFSSAVIVHLIIAMIVIGVMETIGLWYVNNRLVLPPEALYAANWAFQFSIAGSFLSITQVPYSACIIAHERMSIYAYIEILNVSLRLGIVYLLLVWNTDKLILYSALVFSVQLLIIFINRLYCRLHFKECNFELVFDKKIIKPMLSFSGWDMYGSMCVAARAQGINLIINRFLGTVVNAASGIALTVTGTVMGLTNNILIAFRPRIIKHYAKNELEQSIDYLFKSIICSQAFLIAVFIPVLIRTPYIINLWLGQQPEYVVVFIRIILFSTMISLCNKAIVPIIHATGHVKGISFYTGTIFLLSLPFAYLAMYRGLSPEIVYVIMCVDDALIVMSNLIIIKHLIPAFPISSFIRLLLRLIIIMVLNGIVTLTVSHMCENNFISLIFLCFISVVSTMVFTYLFALNAVEKRQLIDFIKAKNHVIK